MARQYSKADTHIHTNYSDGLHDPEAVVHYAATQTDLRVIAITDHNTCDGARDALAYWQRHRREFGQLEVIPGVEVSSSKGHILGLFVQEDIPPHMSPADTVRAIHEQRGLAIAAHPFTHLLRFTDLAGIGAEIAELPLDGVEVRNGAPTELYANWITARFNRRYHNYAPLGGSDAHYLAMIGRAYTLFPGTTAADFREGVQRKEVQPGGRVAGPLLVLQVLLYLLRRRRTPIFLPNDHCYRHTVPGLAVDVEEVRAAPVAVLRCDGVLTRVTADALKAEAARAIAGGRRHLVVDLAGTRFIDSGGLSTLVAMQRLATEGDGHLVLAAPRDQVFKTLQLVRLDKVFSIYPDVPAAVTTLRTSGK